MKLHHVPIAPPTLIASILIAWVLVRYVPYLSLVPEPYHLLGMPVALSGALLFWLAFRCLKLQATTIEPRGTPTSLVERGPYRFTRNPIYLGYLLVAFGVTFFLNDVVAFAAPLIFFITVNTFVIPYEERMLTLTFGARYEDYKQRIRRWI